MRIATCLCLLISLFAAGEPVAAKPATKPAKPANCKTLKGEFVGFGENSTRGDAEKSLDKQIASWEQRYSITAKPKDRKVSCKVYIEWLNEYECAAEAVLCR
jgi:hypothetical protein